MCIEYLCKEIQKICSRGCFETDQGSRGRGLTYFKPCHIILTIMHCMTFFKGWKQTKKRKTKW